MRSNALKHFLLCWPSVLVLGMAMTSGTAYAQSASASDYPRKAIRLVVPFAPGGPVDIVARGIAPRMSEILAQQIVVANRGGAGSTIGTEMAANALPDGYTLLMVSGSYVMNPAMVKKLPYDSVKDFAPIAIVADVPSALVVHPILPARNVQARAITHLNANRQARACQLIAGGKGKRVNG